MPEPQNRVPVFELHIRPMMRLLDRSHMSGSFDLWDLGAVWKKRESILARIQGQGSLMPTSRTGGPWPKEWIDLFKRWVATGSADKPGHHLETAAPDDGEYAIQPGVGNEIRVSAGVTVPTDGYRAWFELLAIREAEGGGTLREYILYVEPPYPQPEPNEDNIAALEKFDKGTTKKIIIQDKNGAHEYPLP